MVLLDCFMQVALPYSVGAKYRKLYDLGSFILVVTASLLIVFAGRFNLG